MTDPNKTLLVALLDRTGSMRTIKTEAEGAFDAFIVGQRDADVGDEVFVTLWQFDATVDHAPFTELVYADRPIADVPPLSIEPRGMTPLNDALVATISETGMRLAALTEDERPGKVAFIVVTDGQENASREYVGAEGTRRVKDLVEHQTDRYSWSFHFLGVGIDAWATSQHLGFLHVNTVSADRDEASIRRSYGASGQSITNYRAGK